MSADLLEDGNMGVALIFAFSGFLFSTPFRTLAVQAHFYVLRLILLWLLMRPTSRQSIWFAAILSLAAYALHYFVMVRWP